MKIGIYGGSFNPVHNGHLHLLQGFQEALGFDRILMVPTCQPPHKTGREMASAADRLSMCRAATQGMGEWLTVSDVEIQRTGRSYTIDTVRELQQALAGDFALLMGEDMFLTLQCWREAAALMAAVEICVVPRSGGSAAVADQAQKLKMAFGARVQVVPLAYMPVSSTQIRALVRSGAETAGLLPPQVAAYIEKRGLYR